MGAGPVFPGLPTRVPENCYPDRCSACGVLQPRSELSQWWISLRVATDVLPLLAHVCSDRPERAAQFKRVDLRPALETLSEQPDTWEAVSAAVVGARGTARATICRPLTASGRASREGGFLSLRPAPPL